MPLFICEECNCIENTALGHYWGRNHVKFKDASKNGKTLCSECAPSEFEDGSIYPKWGKWHGQFEKRHALPTDKVISFPLN